MWAAVLFLALLTTGRVAANMTGLWKEVMALKHCKPRGLCSSGNDDNRHLNPWDMDNNSFRNSLCFCDDDCHLFNDCCADKAPDHLEITTSVLNISRQYWGCQKLAIKSKHYSIYMVTSCPEGHALGPQCSLTVDEENYDYKLDLPMLNAASGVWFQNIFCAICHGQETELKALQIAFFCTGPNATINSVLESGAYVPGNLLWNWTECTCKIDVTMEEDEPDWRRPCMNMHQNCAVDWPDDGIAARCHQYALFQEMRSMPNVLYKNPHCVQCSHLKMTDVRCAKMFRERYSPRPPQSLRLIMDFNWDAKHVSCNRDSVWDVLHQHCEPLRLACSKSAVYRDGQCVPIEDSSAPGELNTDQPDEMDLKLGTCTRTVLAQSDFHILPNKSLQLVLNHSEFYGLMFAPGDYSTLLDGRAEVCNYVFQAGFSNLDYIQGYLTSVCLSISVVCLALHIIIHWLLPKLHNLPGRNLHSLSWALLLAQLIFLTAVTPREHMVHGLCVVFAVTLHFCFLAALCWMNVMSVDIWRTFSAVTTRSNFRYTHLKYSLYAWGAPAAVVSLALIADHTNLLPQTMRPNYASRDTCWFGNPMGLGIFHGLPVSLIVVVNIVLFASTVYKLYHKQESGRYIKKKARAELDQATRQRESLGASPRPVSVAPSGVSGPRDQVRFYLYMKLFIIMGLTWVMGTIAPFVPELWYPFVLLNGLQGAFIFVMFDLKRNVLAMLWQRLLGLRPMPKLLTDRCIRDKNSSSLQNSSSRTSRLTSTSRLSTSVAPDLVRLRIASDAELPEKASPTKMNGAFHEVDGTEEVMLRHKSNKIYSCKGGTDDTFEIT